MKKIISILLSLSMVLSLAFVVYASNGHSDWKKEPVKVSPSPTITTANTLEGLLEQLKSLSINNDLREKLMKLIVEFRKKSGNVTMPVFFNNELVAFESPVMVKGFSASMPAITILKKAGATVIEGNSQIIAVFTTGTTAPVTTYIVIDKRAGKIYKNGTEVSVKASSYKNSKTYIPSEFFSKVMGMTVTYDKNNGALSIFSAGYVPPVPVVLAPTLYTTNPVYTADMNGNGKIDAIVIRFNEVISKASLTNATFTVAGYTVNSVTTDADGNLSAGVGAADGQWVVVGLAESASPDTGATPALTRAGQVLGTTGLATVAIATPVTPVDKAIPVIVSAARSADKALTLTFSEPVYTNNAAPLADVALADFTVTDSNASLGTVNVVISPDKKAVTLTYTGTADVGPDTVAVAANAIYDAAGNAVAVGTPFGF